MSRKGENIYKRKDGRWEARVLEADGKYRYVYAKTYKEVKEKEEPSKIPKTAPSRSARTDGNCGQPV